MVATDQILFLGTLQTLLHLRVEAVVQVNLGQQKVQQGLGVLEAVGLELQTIVLEVLEIRLTLHPLKEVMVEILPYLEH